MFTSVHVFSSFIYPAKDGLVFVLVSDACMLCEQLCYDLDALSNVENGTVEGSDYLLVCLLFESIFES